MIADWSAAQKEIEADRDAVNNVIGQSDFKLKFHKDADQKIIEDGQKAMNELKGVIEKREEASK